MAASSFTPAPSLRRAVAALTSRRRLTFGAGLTLCGLSCSPGPQSSSSTHWLACSSDSDCINSIPGAVCAPDGFCAASDGRRLELKLSLQDEFDGSTLDRQLFGYETGTSLRNDEVQTYTARPENVRVEDGNLILTALAEAYSGADFTSGSVMTDGLFSFTYGRVEARILAPLGRGCSSSLWMMPALPGTAVNFCDNSSSCQPSTWPAWGDILVSSVRSESPNQVLGAINYGIWDATRSAVTHGTYMGSPSELTNPAEWHTYAIDWGPARIDWWVDNQKVRSVALPPPDAYLPGGQNPFQQPFSVRLHLAVGGLDQSPVASDYPQQMRVDWLRVWQWQPAN
jgi:beta-glucanase (GH16 family)